MADRTFAVTIIGARSNGDPWIVGTTVVVAPTTKAAKALARANLWTNRPPTIEGPPTFRLVDLTDGNWALPGCSNPHLDRAGAIEYLVDTALNDEEWEWVGCAVLLELRGAKTTDDARAAIAELATACDVRTDAALLDQVHDQIRRDQAQLHLR